MTSTQLAAELGVSAAFRPDIHSQISNPGHAILPQDRSTFVPVLQEPCGSAFWDGAREAAGRGIRSSLVPRYKYRLSISRPQPQISNQLSAVSLSLAVLRVQKLCLLELNLN